VDIEFEELNALMCKILHGGSCIAKKRFVEQVQQVYQHRDETYLDEYDIRATKYAIRMAEDLSAKIQATFNEVFKS
jgi:hypothetical protein